MLPTTIEDGHNAISKSIPPLGLRHSESCTSEAPTAGLAKMTLQRQTRNTKQHSIVLAGHIDHIRGQHPVFLNRTFKT